MSQSMCPAPPTHRRGGPRLRQAVPATAKEGRSTVAVETLIQAPHLSRRPLPTALHYQLLSIASFAACSQAYFDGALPLLIVCWRIAGARRELRRESKLIRQRR